MSVSFAYNECTMSPSSFILVGLVGAGVLLLMRTRRFYFVRHGETILNAKHIRQGSDGGLSEAGRSQAAQVGMYLQHRSVDLIVSSTYPRALETSKIIQTYLHVPVTSSPLLIERRNPSEIIGQSTHSPEVIRIVDQMDLAYHEDDYRFSDEENFVDLKSRARKCLTLLARQGAPETVVVTHHVILKMLLAYMLYREHLNAADFAKLSFFNVSDNAGVSICEFNPWRILSPTRGWRVISYNEQPA